MSLESEQELGFLMIRTTSESVSVWRNRQIEEWGAEFS